jgi:hypothetical protein
MRRFRFHIGTFVILVLLLAVGLASLRESNDLWASGLFTLAVGVLMISILLAVHRTESRRAFWLGFALFGWIYLGLSLVPSIESRLITTKALIILNSKAPRSIGSGLAYFDFDNDGAMDLYVVNNLQPNALFLNARDGDWIADVTAAGSNPTRFTNILAGLSPTRFGTTENFARIGHSCLALIAALLGGQLSRYLHMKNPQETPGPVPMPVSKSSDPGP